MKSSVILFLILIPALSYTQQIEDTIEIIKGDRKFTLFYKGEILTLGHLEDLTEHNTEAHARVKAAKNNISGAKVIAYAGGFLIGYTLGTAIGGGDPPWGVAAVGAGVLVFTIPLFRSYTNNIREAARLYNSGIMQQNQPKIDLSLGATKSGMGLILLFQ